MTDSLVPPSAMALATADDTMEDTYGGIMIQELRLQREEEDYDKMYISLIREEEESNMDMDTDEFTYPHFT